MPQKDNKGIKFLVTGGTIDGLDYNSKGKAPKLHKSLVPKFLKQSRITIPYKIEILMQKDSKFLTDKDRETIYQGCKNTKEDKIIITHGTMTMVGTAKYLAKKNLNKTIVLVGSGILGSDKDSDVLFNLGTAVMAASLLPKGVYVTMNGKAFYWNNVIKNIEKGIFTTID